jgi:hypothetical protein
MKYLIITLLFSYVGINALEYEYRYFSKNDSTYNSCILILPNTDSIKGIVIRDFTKLPSESRVSNNRFAGMCSDSGYITLITDTSDNIPELFISNKVISRLDSIIKRILDEYNITDNIFIGGISASGTRALRYAQYCNMGNSDIEINGVFVVDSPLDLERFYLSAKNHKKYFKKGMLMEAEWMIPYFENIFGGDTYSKRSDYIESSVFSHSEPNGGNALSLKDTPIIIYHEPDIDWWIKNRGAGYYDINSFDLSSFKVLMDNAGNNDIELITTTGKGFNKNGNRQPHSWSIVDEQYLLKWIIKRSN